MKQFVAWALSLLLAIAPASAQMTMTGVGGGGFGVAAGGSFALTYQDSKTAASGSTPLTYTGFTVAGGATRTVAVVLWQGGATPGITSMTIGGVACTQVSSAFANVGGDQSADVWISNSAITGGTINVAITYASSTSYYSAVALYNLTTATPSPGPAANAVNSSPAPSISVGAITIPTGGGAVFGAFEYFGATGSITSGNVAIDASPAAGGITWYFGHGTATGSQTATFTYSGNDNGVATFASWGP